MTERLLLEALELASEGRKLEARRLLWAVLRKEKTNETAWLWLADCSDTLEERAQVLQNCLRSLPDSQRARAAMARLRFTARAAGRQQQIPLTGTQPLNGNHRSAGDTRADDSDWQLTGGANIFTVSPDALSPQEFAEVEARTKRYLHKRPELRKLKVQLVRHPSADDWSELTSTTGRRRPKPQRDAPQPLPAPAAKKQVLIYAAAAALILLAAVVLVGVLIAL